MIANAALFFFGAMQDAALSLGRIHEPKIIAGAIVETICGVFLLYGGCRYRSFLFGLDGRADRQPGRFGRSFARYGGIGSREGAQKRKQ